MKTVSLFLTAAMLFAAPTVHAKWVKVPETQAKELKQALSLTEFDCSPAINMQAALQSLGAARDVLLDDSGTQPVLKFISYNSSGDDMRVLFTLSTSQDFRKIEILTIEEQKAKLVNRGTLVQPRIVKEYSNRSKWECR